ncbi:glycine/betaine ABC transporter substrate-binding protein [Methanoplanus sp. FWC-SCC4]|uniref:Glycine/betaine ABC transporter substrate-binding protein n=1 Tax=Methanochimaera problematica TaxID=2609417 RepID=A0AA97I4E6_9EURY|nr:glycine betaine ABC transporter substrate-binding protein [Methanoplanus sp. FWC-SCC4]WOF16261.1 glycine/betaine ABC transporter substrate-binding protein [Methanoplanus sp. FWC-SCC4]
MKSSYLTIFVIFLCISCCIIAGCTSDSNLKANNNSDEQKVSKIVIGAKPFNEQYILSEMVAILLEDKGFDTEIKSGMNDATLYEGIKRGQIDIYIEYTGTAYSQLLKLEPLETWDTDTVYSKVNEGLKENGITPLFKIGFRDDYAIAVKKDWAEDNNVNTIEDLITFAPDMTFGSDLVFHEREDGLLRLKEVYNIEFMDIKPMSPTLMYEAIDKDQVSAIPPYTTDARVTLYNLKILEDNKAAMPPYETMLLIRSELAENKEIVSALNVLNERIDTDKMRELNLEFDIDKKDANDIAKRYLMSEGLISNQ